MPFRGQHDRVVDATCPSRCERFQYIFYMHRAIVFAWACGYEFTRSCVVVCVRVCSLLRVCVTVCVVFVSVSVWVTVWVYEGFGVCVRSC